MIILYLWHYLTEYKLVICFLHSSFFILHSNSACVHKRLALVWGFILLFGFNYQVPGRLKKRVRRIGKPGETPARSRHCDVQSLDRVRRPACMVCALVLRVKEPHVINLSLPFSFKEKPLFDVWLFAR